MKKTLTVVGAIVLGLVVIAGCIALAFALELGGLKWKEFFAPKHQDVERKVFKRTRSFNEAKKQELLKYRLEYLKASSPIERDAIANTIRHAFANYDESLLEPELREFLKQIKYGVEKRTDF